MIHHRYTCLAGGYPVEEVLDVSDEDAVRAYFQSVTEHSPSDQMTVAVWKDGAWCAYFVVTAALSTRYVNRVREPKCFEPLPCPKPTHAVTAPAFASCAKDGQEVAFMALERRIRELGAEAEDYRGAGLDALADILVGQQSACLAAVKALRDVAR